MHINCDACTGDKCKPIVGKENVCTNCPQWIMECEARFILTMDRQARRTMIESREQKRGKESVDQLKERIKVLFYDRQRT